MVEFKDEVTVKEVNPKKNLDGTNGEVELIDDDDLDDDDDETKPIIGGRERFFSDPPVPTWRRIGYALGGIPRTSLNHLIGVYFTIFLLEIARIPAIYASVILLFGKCLNALSDPVIGFLVSHSPDTRFGKYAPWMLASIPFVVVLYLLLWFVPPIPIWAKVLYYFVVFWLLSLSQTCYAVPLVSSVMAMSNSQRQRDGLVASRMACEAAGSIVGLSIQALFLFLGRKYHWGNDTAYMGSALTLGAIFAVLGFVSFLSIDERYALHHGTGKMGSVFKPFAHVLKFRPYTILAGCILFVYVGYSVILGIYTLYFKYVWDVPALFPICAVIIFICSALSIPIWHRVVSKLGKKTTLTIGIFVMMILFWSHLYLPYNIVLAISVSVLSGIFIGCAQLVPASMLPDVIAAYSIDHGVGKEPLFYSITIFIDTLGNAVCSALTTMLLAVAGYDSTASQFDQPPAVALTLRLIVGVFPVISFLIALICLWEYPINTKSREEMRAAIKKSMSGSASKKSTAGQN